MFVRRTPIGSIRWTSLVLLALALGLPAATGAAAEPGAPKDREAPKFYLTGLGGGSWAAGDAEGTTTSGGTIAGSSDASSAFGGIRFTVSEL